MTLIQPSRHWVCPNCANESITHEARPHTRVHTCPGLKGLTAPMVAAGTRCEVRAVEREDYLGTDAAQTDADGRPIMAVITIREDGQDTAVLAPLATIAARS
jgi:hypothetical protein